ncbi:hypothetical protein OIDMADRAFT_139776 [Oidiodendron maius Zn]|uniref:Rhodopsin domain-containing protein n=1 Tax=Oidiodendron maius (strain Zn) TaxID=913774 RepID=A0A0C3DYI3_OIDMZ|nr:hypothetical protein OIDMADRAFT_139776 [Oidiodendron maius Zn]
MSGAVDNTSGAAAPFRGNILLGTTLAFGISAFLVVTLRVVFRASRRKIGISDYCIASAMLMSFTHMVFDALCVTKFGYGRHEFDLPASIRTSGTPLMLFWLGQILFKLSILFTKLSLFFIYRDLFAQVDSTIIRITNAANYVTAFIVISYYGAATLLIVDIHTNSSAASYKTP